MDDLKRGNKTYHFVEIMGCTGGCINGGGQPIVPAKIYESTDVRGLRASVLYNIDEKQSLRKSHLNQSVMRLYKDFLEKPNSHKSHELLHTHYQKRSMYEHI
jgi:iron only hydrogenase large subunit-like protein